MTSPGKNEQWQLHWLTSWVWIGNSCWSWRQAWTSHCGFVAWEWRVRWKLVARNHLICGECHPRTASTAEAELGWGLRIVQTWCLCLCYSFRDAVIIDEVQDVFCFLQGRSEISCKFIEHHQISLRSLSYRSHRPLLLYICQQILQYWNGGRLQLPELSWCVKAKVEKQSAQELDDTRNQEPT